jgi:hexulose-6-phosphate isomerase
MNPTRRHVLASTAAAAAAMAAAPSFAAETAAASKRPTYKKAIMFEMLKASGSLTDKFQLLKDCGFDGVTLNAPGQYKVDEVREACKRTGIQVEGVCGAFHWKVTLTDPDPKIRATAVENLKNQLRECQEFGGGSALCVPGVVNERVSYDDAYKRSQDGIRQAVSVAAETGVKIAVENVWNHFLLSPLEAARYVDEFESPHVGWHFDIGNVITYGWPEQWIRILGKRISRCHFKEFSRKKRDQEGLWKGFQVELLDGESNNWPVVMKALDEVGYNSWAIAEVPGGGADRMKFISERLDRIINI